MQKRAYLNTIYNKNAKYIRKKIDLVLITKMSDIFLSYISVPLDGDSKDVIESDDPERCQVDPQSCNAAVQNSDDAPAISETEGDVLR